MSDPTGPVLICALALAVGGLLVGCAWGLTARRRLPHKGPPDKGPPDE
jgi:hypothetical protein